MTANPEISEPAERDFCASMGSSPISAEVQARARHSLGTSGAAVYRTTLALLSERISGGDLLVDVGCGIGNFHALAGHRFSRYVGVDAIRHSGLPAGIELIEVDLDSAPVPLPGNRADAVVALGIIEYLENPRTLMRELVRLARPSGWIIVSTPNQLSLVSLLNLAVRHRFAAFHDQSSHSPQTALLESDLRRIAAENSLVDICIEFTKCGRVPCSARSYPKILARRSPRFFSDDIILVGRKA